MVINMAKDAWNSYVLHAWGQDELHPLTLSKGKCQDNGKTIIAAMSTLWLMELKEEFKMARQWIETRLDIEAIVREKHWEVPGALLSVYALTKDETFLHKARQIVDRFMDSGKK